MLSTRFIRNHHPNRLTCTPYTPNSHRHTNKEINTQPNRRSQAVAKANAQKKVKEDGNKAKIVIAPWLSTT